ncbi:lipase family protein [Rhodococcus sp. NPDC127528]|uniref:lipase family protein n=1 Tax=unclassified Rhodococcus (in: high G+C Gram-positive bacteria) TaxID=192944 RepID=UPI003632474F
MFWVVVASTVLAMLVSLLPAIARAADTDPGRVVGRGELVSASSLAGAAEGYRLTYWTEGPAGAPALSTGAVYLPRGVAPAGGWPVVSWAHGTTGVADDCAPSFGDVSALTRDYLDTWLGAGFAVVATDYVGLGTAGVHAYLHGRSEGRAVIDMVRAATSVAPELSRTWLAVGHSQGGHAAMFAAHEATNYAPELDYRGAVATGTPANLDQLFPLGGPGFPDLGLTGLTGFAAYVVDGLRVARPDLPVDELLSPAGAAIVEDSETMCFTELADRAGSVGVGEMLARPLDTPQFRDAVRDYLAVPTAGYDRPVFVGHGLSDRTVPYPLGAKLAADLFANGQDVTFRTYPSAHQVSLTQSLPDVIAFARAHI